MVPPAARARRASTACASSRWARRRTTAVAAEEGATLRPGRLDAVSASSDSRDPWASATSGTGRSSTSASPRRTRTGTTRTATPPRRALEQSYRERPNVRRLTPRRRGAGVRRLDRVRGRRGRRRARRRRRRARRERRAGAARSRRCRTRARVKVHLVLPRSFNDAQQIADKFKQGDPGDPQPPERRHRALEAADRLRERAHLRAERRHAARRRQGLPAHAAQRRGVAPRSARALLERGGFFNQA